MSPRSKSAVWTFFRLRPNNFPPLRIAQATGQELRGCFAERLIPRYAVELLGNVCADLDRDVLDKVGGIYFFASGIRLLVSRKRM